MGRLATLWTVGALVLLPVQAQRTVSGVVYEDVNYGGGAGRPRSTATGWQAASNGASRATVELYDGSGAFLATTQAAADGSYAFASLADGSYQVRLVTQTAPSSRSGWVNTLRPVLTFRTDATSGAAVGVTDYVGGENPALPDTIANSGTQTLAQLTSANARPQAVAPVTISGSDITGVDFGINFSTITTTRDAGQGTLRQFITNANAMAGQSGLAQSGTRMNLGVSQALPAGYESSIFMIPSGSAVPGIRAGVASQLTAGVAAITAATALPTLSRANVALDGTTQTANIGDANPVLLGAGGTVGVDALTLNRVPGPEVQITGAIWLNGANTVLRGVALAGSSGALGVQGASAVVEQNVIGTSATSFSDPGSGNRMAGGCIGVGSTSVQIRSNLIGFCSGSGITNHGVGAANSLVVQGNEIRGTSIVWSNFFHAIMHDGGAGWQVSGNLIASNLSTGIGARYSTGATSGFQITNNTMTGNTAGITLNGTGHAVSKNVISGSTASAISLSSGATQAVVTQNRTFGNNTQGTANRAVAISLGGSTNGTTRVANDGLKSSGQPNQLMDQPVFTTALLNGTALSVAGYVGSAAGQSTFAGALVEVFVSDNNATGFGEGQTFIDTVYTDASGNFSKTFTGVSGIMGTSRITGTATDASGNTSEFGANALVTGTLSISGTIFEDVNYGGGAGRPRSTATGWQPAANGSSRATVELYDGSGTFLATAQAAADGTYSFANRAAGSYQVRVLTPTAPSSRSGWVNTLRPVLTFRTDASGGTTVTAVSDRVGGEDPTLADTTANSGTQTLAQLTSANARPQAVAPVTLTTGDITGVDFGINFSTITSTRNAGQGTLRQWITNANAMAGQSGLAQGGTRMNLGVSQALPAGVETSIFMVSSGSAVPGIRAAVASQLTGGVATMTPATALPALTRANVALDGTTQTANVGNTNGVLLGTGGTVGVDAIALPQVPGPEVQISGSTSLTGLQVSGASSQVRGVAALGFSTTLTFGSASGVVEQNVIGTSATSFTDPGAGIRTTSNAIGIGAATNAVIRNNLIGFASASGITNYAIASVDGLTIQSNEIRGNTITAPTYHAIMPSAGNGWTVRNNLLAANGSSAVQILGGNGHQFINNTVTGNAVTSTSFAALTLTGTGIVAQKNIISGHPRTAISTGTGATQVQITRNSAFGNNTLAVVGLASGISLGGAGSGTTFRANDGAKTTGQPNQYMDHPVFTSALLSGTSLTVAGYVGTAAGQTAFGGALVEVFVSDNDATGFGEGQTFIDTVTTDASGNFSKTFTGVSGVTGTSRITGTATDASGNTSEFGANALVTDTLSISGTIFEDVNYGGGAGRPRSTATGWQPASNGSSRATVELYDGSGTFLATAQAAADGTYSFANRAAGNYQVRLVAQTTPSSRAGWVNTLRPVLTFRTNASTGTATDVTDRVGGENPLLSDTTANTGSQTLAQLTSANAQPAAVAPVTLSTASIANVDFGVHFTTVTNTRDTGNGSLRQAITNANALTGDASLSTAGRAAGTEHVIFMLSNGTTGSGGSLSLTGGLRAANNAFTTSAGSYNAATITLAGAGLPVVSSPLVIDAQTQPGWTLEPRIEINANGLFGTVFSLNAGSSVLRGFVVNRLTTSGNSGAALVINTAGGNIVQGNWFGLDVGGATATAQRPCQQAMVYTGANQIGGTSAAQRNVFSNAGCNGLVIWTGSGNRIQGNYIGLNAAGTAALPNAGSGIVLPGTFVATGTIIGGSTPGEGNVISGMQGTASNLAGIAIQSANHTGTIIRGNRIGTNADGTASVGNASSGILAMGSFTIGGGAPGEGNQIAGSTGAGILVQGATSVGAIQGNLMGLAVDSTSVLANGTGVRLEGAATGTVVGSNYDGTTDAAEGNRISGSGKGIVVVNSGTVARIARNRISGNTGLGIDLVDNGVSANDGATTAGQPNVLMDHPVFTTALLNGTSLTVAGYVGSAASQSTFANALVEVFVSDNDGTGFGEGATFIDTVRTDASGNFSRTFTGVSGITGGATRITGTATDASGNTSEFGANALVTVPTYAISGTIFEDMNYGGGAGRPRSTATGWAAASNGSSRATVELYDGSGTFLSTTQAAADGTYSFTNRAAGSYQVRVLTQTAPSSRTGWVNTLRPVLTFRTDASGGTTANAVTDRVGGEDPTIADTTANSGTQTLAQLTSANARPQAVAPVTLSASNITGVDFGVHFTTVTNTLNTGAGSLRQVITNANALGGDASLLTSGRTGSIEHVVFMLPNGSTANGDATSGGTLALSGGLRSAFTVFSGGIATITPQSALPAVTGPLVLDAQTQPGWTSTPVLELTGTSAGAGASGLTVNAGGSRVRGLVVNRFSTNGLTIAAPGVTVQGNYLGTTAAGSAAAANGTGLLITSAGVSDTVGGVSSAQRNVVSGNSGWGMDIAGASTVIMGNYVGTTADGATGLSNGTGTSAGGMLVSAANVTIGGSTTAHGNVITGYDGTGPFTLGLEITGAGADVRNNLVGLNAAGTAVLSPAVWGMRLSGGGATVRSNTFTGSGSLSLWLNSSANTVAGNTFNVARGSLTPVGSGTAMVFTNGANDNVIGGSTPADANVMYLAGTDVGVATNGGVSLRTRITRNVMFGPSTAPGIDLGSDGVTANDGVTNAAQFNNGMDSPVFTMAFLTGSTLSVAGHVGSASGQSQFANALVEVFVSSNSPTGFGSGQTFIDTVYTDASGNFSRTFTGVSGISAGTTRITGTATDASGNTSEFGANLVVAGPTYTIAGTIFEDMNYGGGAGRPLGSAPGWAAASNGTARATVELYDASGAFLATTQAAADGSYAFSGRAPGDYQVRLVTPSTPSARTGWVSTLRPVLTYRTDASNGATASGVTDRVGGEDPAMADTTANTGTQTLAQLTGTAARPQAVAPVTLTTAGISGVDFGVHFTTVTSTRSSGAGSLRQAITNANTLGSDASLATTGRASGIEHVVFMLPNGTTGSGGALNLTGGLRASQTVFTTPGYAGNVASLAAGGADLKTTAPVIIDAQTQPGWTLHPAIVLPNVGVVLSGGSSALRGFMFTTGSRLIVDSLPGNVVQGNWFGVAPNGTSRGGSGAGCQTVQIYTSNNLFGGATPAQRNIVSDADCNGLIVWSGDANAVRGNYFGTDVTGTLPLLNAGRSVIFKGTNSVLGGTSGGEGNLIAGSRDPNPTPLDTYGAVVVRGTNLQLLGNTIGLTSTGTATLGGAGYGIVVTDATATIGGTAPGAGNTIAGVALAGVWVDTAGVNVARISGNAIYGTGGLGIDLRRDGVTVNDGATTNGAPNLLMDHPVFTTASLIGSALTVRGYVGSAPGQTAFANALVEVFVSDNHASGYGSGQRFIDTVYTDASGMFRKTFTGVTGITTGSTRLTATATDASGNTSEFGANILTTGVQADVVAVMNGPTTGTAGVPELYRVTVRNDGPSVADSVAARVTLPAGVTPSVVSGSGVASGSTITWPVLPTLMAGDSAQFTFSTTALAAGSYAYSVAVSSLTPDQDSTNNNGTATAARVSTVLSAGADVTVASGTAAPFTLGVPAVLVRRITNIGGAATAGGLTLTDTLPAGMTFANSTGTGWSCGAAAAVVTCTGAALAAGDSTLVTLTAMLAPAAAPRVIVPSRVVAPGDVNPVNDMLRDSIAVSGRADLQLVATVAPLAQLGGVVRDTITVTNAGPSPADAVVVTHPVPAGLTLVSVTGDCTTLPCALGTVPAAATRRAIVAWQVPVAYAGPDPITFVARVASTTPDPVATNDTVAVTSSVNAGTVAGAVFDDRNGNATRDAGEPGVASVAIALVTALGDTLRTTTDAAGTYTVPGVPVGTATLLVNDASSGTGFVRTTAAGTQTLAVTLQTTLQAAAVGFQYRADVQTVLTGPLTATAGVPAPAYLVRVTNLGAGIAAQVVPRVTVPAGMTVTPADGGTVSGGVITWPAVTSLAAGDSARVSFTATTLTPGSYAFTAASASTTADGTPANNDGTMPTARVTTVVTGGVDVALSVATVAPFTIGVPAALVRTVTNVGIIPTAGPVSLTDTLPAGMQFVSGSGAGWTCTTAGAVVQCAGPVIAAGDSSRVSITTTITGAALPRVIVPSVLTAAGDINLANNTVRDSVPVTSGIDLTLRAVASGEFTVGKPGVVTRVVRNAGTGPTTGEITITDTLPAGLTYRSATGTGWGCSTASTVLTCAHPTVLAPGDSTALDVTFDVARAAMPSVTLASRVSTPDELSVGNNTASLTLAVRANFVLFAEVTSQKSTAEIGDPVDFTGTVKVAGESPVPDVTLNLTLPRGFAYQPGTLFIEGASPSASVSGVQPRATAALGGALLGADPVRATDGTYQVALGDLAAGATARVRWRVRLGPGSQRSDGITRGQAVSPVVSSASNKATAAVKVQGGVFSDRGIAFGKVFLDCDCEGADRAFQDTHEVGIPGVRLILEDGTTVLTDAEGKYSVPGLAPRLHVVKLDVSSLPDGAVLVLTGNRNAGDAASRFVDLTNGEFQKADFAVARRQAVLRAVRERRRAAVMAGGGMAGLAGAANGTAAERGVPHENTPNDAGVYRPSVRLLPPSAFEAAGPTTRDTMLADGADSSTRVVQDGVASRAAGDTAAARSATAPGMLTWVPRRFVAAGLLQGRLELRNIRGARADDGFDAAIKSIARQNVDSTIRGGARGAFYLTGDVATRTRLTLAWDSERDKDIDLLRDINPDDDYAVYGDASIREYDARSAGSLSRTAGRGFARIDRDRSTLLVGDFAAPSGDEMRQLSAYGRTLTGVREHIEIGDSTRAASLDGFASRSTLAQRVEELPGEGISGPYRLSRADVKANSEQVELVVRDRNQPAVVLSRTPLGRFTDYTLERDAGRLLFRAPVPSVDAQLNPVSVRVTYEVEQGGDAFWSYGADGRVRHGAVTFGAAAVRDENPLARRDLLGAYGSVQLARGTALVGELARSDGMAVSATTSTTLDSAGAHRQGDAARVEFRHQSRVVSLRLAGVMTSSAFANPSATAPAGRTEIGGNGSVALTAHTRLLLQMLRTEDRLTGGRRDGALASVEQQLWSRMRVELGLRWAEENRSPVRTDSSIATPAPSLQPNSLAALRSRLTVDLLRGTKLRSSVSAEFEQDLRIREQQRAAVSGDIGFARGARLYARHEFLKSANGPFGLGTSQQQASSVIGLTADLRSNQQLFNEYRLRDGASGRQAEAAIGLRNRFRLDSGIVANASFERVSPLGGTTTAAPAASSARALAIATGLELTRWATWRGTARAELRQTPQGNSWLGSAGLAQQVARGVTLLARGVYTTTAGQQEQLRGQVGLAVRPVDSDWWNALARVDVRNTANTPTNGPSSTTRATIVSLQTSVQASPRVAVSSRYALKLALDDAMSGAVRLKTSTTNQLVSTRVLYDLTKSWDVGLVGSVLGDATFTNRQYGLGAQVGRIVMRNLRVAAGYNLFGWRDADLSGASSNTRGAFVEFGYKFDEQLFGRRSHTTP